MHVQKYHAGEMKETIVPDDDYVKNEDVEIYTCKLCGKYFSQNKQYQSHLRVHNKTVKCTVCPLMFRTKYDMTKHFSVHEKGLYPCTVCGKNYKLMGKHMQEEHGLSYQDDDNPLSNLVVEEVEEDAGETDAYNVEYLIEDEGEFSEDVQMT